MTTWLQDFNKLTYLLNLCVLNVFYVFIFVQLLLSLSLIRVCRKYVSHISNRDYIHTYS